MEYRQLGRSGLKVSALCLGTMTFGGRGVFADVGSADAKTAGRQMAMAIDAGINILDTANIYSDGVSEEIIGEALPVPRDQILLATKCRMRIGAGPNQGGASRLHIISELEKSLKRLRTDYVDLYQMHQWDGLTPLEETMEALDTLVRSGKVRYIGASNYSGWHLMKALAVSERSGFQRFVSQQIHYSLQAREAEYELIPITLDQGLGTMIWSPLGGGLLSGKYRRGVEAPPGTRHLTAWSEPPVRDEEQLYDIVDVILAIAGERRVSGAEVALAWLLGRPGITTLIIGARTDDQLASNLKAADLVLTESERSRLDKASQPPLLYPYWHQARTASDRLGDADRSLLSPFV